MSPVRGAFFLYYLFFLSVLPFSSSSIIINSREDPSTWTAHSFFLFIICSVLARAWRCENEIHLAHPCVCTIYRPP